MRGLPSILSLFHNGFNKCIISRAIVRFYDFESLFWCEKIRFSYNVRNLIMDVML